MLDGVGVWLRLEGALFLISAADLVGCESFFFEPPMLRDITAGLSTLPAPGALGFGRVVEVSEIVLAVLVLTEGADVDGGLPARGAVEASSQLSGACC